MLNNFQCFLGASRTLKLLKFGHNVPLQRFPITFFLFFCVHFSPNTGQVFLDHVYKYYLTNVLNLKTDNLSTIAATLFHRWESEDKQGKWLASPQTVKNLPVMQETWVQSLGGEDPLEKRVATHSNILAGEFHGQRSMAGYSPWSQKQLDTTEQFSFSLQRPHL